MTSQAVSVRRAGSNRYRLRAVFPFSGRQLLAGRRRLGVVSVRPAPALVSALPTAQAFRLCGGTGPPYPQYALSRDPARRAVGLLSPAGSSAPNLAGLGRDARSSG